MCNNRWINKAKAYNLNVKQDPIETNYQQAFTRKIQDFIKEIHNATSKVLYFPLVYEDSNFYKKMKNK